MIRNQEREVVEMQRKLATDLELARRAGGGPVRPMAEEEENLKSCDS
jgi:hypothetical protein